MKTSTILAGALLIVSSEAWTLKFSGKDEDGERTSFTLGSWQKRESCHKLGDDYTDLVVDYFSWDPSNDNFPDTVNAFITYDTSDCTDAKHNIKWYSGVKTTREEVDTPQKIRSYRVGGGKDLIEE